MTPLAITFMIIAMLVIWGGLVVSLVFLARHPLPPETAPETEPEHRPEPGSGSGSGHIPGQWPGPRR